MKVHLVDGTYELFRSHFGAPSRIAPNGREIGATAGLLASLLKLLSDPEVTHLAVAFDHVIESFRNDLYPGYKTSEGIDPNLFEQFQLAEEATRALGAIVWPMVEFEADDALATAAYRFKDDARVNQIVICSPDKDLSQMVSGKRIVCLDRRREITLDENGVLEKFGVFPASIPDWLALAGDNADGYPGIPGWGAKSAAAVLREYEHIEYLPDDPAEWRIKSISAGRAATLARNLATHREEAKLYLKLATLRHDVPLKERLEDLEWRGSLPEMKKLAISLGIEKFAERIPRWRD
jgi:5'-3' exonuclease